MKTAIAVTITFFLFSTLIGCGSGIKAGKLTTEQKQSICTEKTLIANQAVLDIKKEYDPIVFGDGYKNFTPTELDAKLDEMVKANKAAEKLIATRKFWCEEITSGTPIYEKDGKIFLSLQEAKDYKN